MTPEAAVLVRTGWTVLGPEADGFADRFITRLIEQDASLGVFVVDAGRETAARACGETLARMMEVLDEPDRLVGLLVGLGRTLDGWGIGQRDHDAARAALFMTLAEALGDRFTPEMDDAWHELYALASAVTLRARGNRAAASPGAP
jgi:hemoglobin-like flavoprotein